MFPAFLLGIILVVNQVSLRVVTVGSSSMLHHINSLILRYFSRDDTLMSKETVMRVKQPSYLCKPRRKRRVKVDASKNWLPSPLPPVIIAGRPKRYFHCGFYCYFALWCGVLEWDYLYIAVTSYKGGLISSYPLLFLW